LFYIGGIFNYRNTVTLIENDSKRDIFRNLVIIHLIIRVLFVKDILLLLMRSQSLGVKLCLNDNWFESPPSSVPPSAISSWTTDDNLLHSSNMET
jgi:hypothetical protein